jgi:succinyl-CoA synthetase beta subunit
VRLLEHQSKTWLRSRGLPVPEGFIASQADQVAVAVNRLGGPVVVKALVPAGRRGKAGAVRFAANAEEAARAASEILETTVAGYRVDEV